MKRFLLCFFILFAVKPAYSSQRTDSLMVVLKAELAKAITYDNNKEAAVKKLKQSLRYVSANTYETQYSIYSRLYEEYRVYQFDSAYNCVKKLDEISHTLNDKRKINECRIKYCFLLLSGGMFIESFEISKQVDPKVLSDSSKVDYYTLKARLYSDLADYNNNKYYTPNDNKLSLKYIDSGLIYCRKDSYQQYNLLSNRELESGDTLQPSPYLIKLLLYYPLTAHQRAMAATGLSFFFNSPEQAEEHKYLLEVGAINDLRSSTKETLAAFKLGEQLFAEGDIANAYLFIQHAANDAKFYGSRLRKTKIAVVLPTVAAAVNINAQKDKIKIIMYMAAIAIIALIIIAVSFIVFVQLKKLKAKEVIIEEKNIELKSINDKLLEDARIKEEYIGYFFNLVSGYILKLEKIKRSIERKVAARKFDDLLLTTNDINIKKERDALFYTFDHIFLKIFPNFLTTFNSLLKKEDQIWPKEHEVLNTDLRIFALMRLGVSDVESIANILEYSVNTIYVYKTRIKAKAIVPNDEFESIIMNIKALEPLDK